MVTPNQKKITKKMLVTLNGQKTTTPPLWLMRQAGRHLKEYLEIREKAKNFLEFCYTPDLAVEATLQPIRRYGFDAAILFSDILVIPDALGQQVDFVPGTGPKLEAISSFDELEKLSKDGLHDHLSPVYEAIGKICCELPEETILIGFAGAPWTIATYVVEGGGSKNYLKTRKWAYDAPDEFGVLIDILVDATADHLIRQIESGVEVVQLFDSWAGVLPPSQFVKWSIEPAKKIITRIRAKHPDIPIIGFPRGAGLLYQRFVQETGVNAISIDATVPVTWAAKNLQPYCAVQGNLDNLALLTGGPAMEAEVAHILAAFADGPFIFNLGHGILPETPVPHVKKLIELVRGTSVGAA
jgi:uroporphyrinogen decarboxylase